jgi:hypothetical protein
MFIVFFVYILVPRHKSRESVKIGPYLGGHPTSGNLAKFKFEFEFSQTRFVKLSK